MDNPKNLTLNPEAFSLQFNQWGPSIDIRYKGITIDKLEYSRINSFDSEYKGLHSLEYYIKLQGKAILEAIQDGKLPEDLKQKAITIDIKGEGIEDQSKWLSSDIFLMEEAKMNMGEIKDKIFATVALGEIINKHDNDKNSVTASHQI